MAGAQGCCWDSRAMAAAAQGSLGVQIKSDLESHRTMCRLAENETLLHSWKGPSECPTCSGARTKA